MDHTAAEETDDEESVAESPGPDDRRGGGGGDAAAAAETYALVGRRATVTRTRSGRTIAEERDSQRQLLLLALLEQFVASYEKDPNRSRTLYLQICKQLVRSGVRRRRRARGRGTGHARRLGGLTRSPHAWGCAAVRRACHAAH